MDISLQICIDVHGGVISDDQRRAAVYRRGDIVGVYDSSTITEPPYPGNPLGFMHVTGVPDIIPLEKIRNRITREILIPAPYVIPMAAYAWAEREANNDYAPFIAKPTASIYPDIALTQKCFPESLQAVLAKFSAVDSQTYDDQTGQYTIIGTTPAVLLTGEKLTIGRKREWRVPPSVLPANARNALIENREITVTWSQAKPYIRKKIISNRLDASSDDELTELADGDLA